MQPDQTGAEALVVAYECRPGRYRRLFELGIKPHSYTALQIFLDEISTARGQPKSRYAFVDPDTLISYEEYKALFAEIKSNDTQYALGKRVRHARNYKMGPRTFQLNTLELSQGKVNLSYADSKRILDTDARVFTEIDEWQAETAGRLAATRTLHNLFGYPRYFGGIWSDALERDGLSFVPQSTVGTITNRAFTALWHYIKAHKLPWLLLNNKHDSLLLSLPDTAEHREHARAVAKQHIEIPLVSTRGDHYQMGCGISWGYNWAPASADNPDGMKEE